VRVTVLFLKPSLGGAVASVESDSWGGGGAVLAVGMDLAMAKNS